MANYNKIWAFTEDLAKKVHNLGSDALTIALVPTASALASTHTTLAGVSQIAYTSLTPVARTPTLMSCAQTSGTLKLILSDYTLSATGPVAAFGKILLFNDTAASDQLICWWEYGSDVTLANTETFTLDFDNTAGILQLV